MPITANAFNYTNGGKIMAYAVSYDWSHGYKGNVPGHPNKIMLHALTVGRSADVRYDLVERCYVFQNEEIKKRPKN